MPAPTRRALTQVPAGSNLAGPMQHVADDLAAKGWQGYIIPGGGSNALGGLGWVDCAQVLQQQFLEQGVKIGRVAVGSGDSGTHCAMVAGFPGHNMRIPIVGNGVSRDPADQASPVFKEAQAVVDLLDPVCAGKIMAAVIGLAGQGFFRPYENVRFLHTGGQPSLHVRADWGVHEARRTMDRRGRSWMALPGSDGLPESATIAASAPIFSSYEEIQWAFSYCKTFTCSRNSCPRNWSN